MPANWRSLARHQLPSPSRNGEWGGQVPGRKDDRRHGDEGKLKPRVPDEPRLDGQDDDRGQKDGVHRAARALENQGQQIHHGYDGRADGGNPRPGQKGEQDNDGNDGERCRLHRGEDDGPARKNIGREPPEEGEEHEVEKEGDEAHMKAADRQNMARPGQPERFADLAVQILADAQGDGFEKAGRLFGKRLPKVGAHPVPESEQPSLKGESLHRLDALERAGGGEGSRVNAPEAEKFGVIERARIAVANRAAQPDPPDQNAIAHGIGLSGRIGERNPDAALDGNLHAADGEPLDVDIEPRPARTLQALDGPGEMANQGGTPAREVAHQVVGGQHPLVKREDEHDPQGAGPGQHEGGGGLPDSGVMECPPAGAGGPQAQGSHPQGAPDAGQGQYPAGQKPPDEAQRDVVERKHRLSGEIDRSMNDSHYGNGGNLS